MEVSVISALNLPQDSIISIRSGETRRQAPFKLNQVFRFPHGSSNPFKVDVFAPLGHHNVNANSLQEGKNSLKLCMNSIELDLKIVKGTNGNTGDVKNERLNSALQARSYLDEHDLVSSLQLMLQEVIKNKPSDPMDYMIGYLGRNKKSSRVPSAAPKEEAPPAPAAPAAEPEKPAAPAPAEEPKREAEPVPEAAPPAAPAAAPAAAPKADDSNMLEEELEVEAEVEVEVEAELEVEAEIEAELRRRKGGSGGGAKAVDGAPPAGAEPTEDAAQRAKDEIVAGAIGGEAYMEDELELELEAELEAEMEMEMEMELETELRMKQRGG